MTSWSKEGMIKSNEKIMNAKRLKLSRMKEYIRSKRVSFSEFHLQMASFKYMF